MDKSQLEKSERERDSQVPVLKYSNEEETYRGNLVSRLTKSKDLRDKSHDQFDGQTFLQYVESNRKGANTYVEPKKNKEDTNYSSGTIRQKLLAYLASLNNLDLQPDIQAFDRDNNEIMQLGESMEDIQFKVGELDNDEEKKLLRQYSLLEQGTVFVSENWDEKFRKKKSFHGKFNGKIKSVSWTSRLKKEFARCTREILMPENVYLGDIYQFEMMKQPYIFTVEIRSYEEAEAIYGKWERWKNVSRKVKHEANDDTEKKYTPMRIFDVHNKDEVEIIKYQDKWNDEFMIMINGVMMLPVGFPLSAMTPTGDYMVAKQVAEIISPHFAYGKSLVARMKNNAALLDEMTRMAILKTQKSFAPPMFNNTGRVLSSRIFAPGKITMGVDGEKITKVDPEGRSVDSGESHMLEMLQKNIDRSSVDPTYQGQQPQGTPTATQILEVQRQAKLMIGLTVFVCAMLEKKLVWLRIYNILHNWFKKTGGYEDQLTGEFVNRYRSISRNKVIPGEGQGRQIIRLTDNLPSSKQVMEEENELSTLNNPVRVIYLKPSEIKSSKYMWYITVTPKERKTDALNKVLFDEFMQKAMMFPNVDVEYLGEEFAQVWEKNSSKLFKKREPAPEQAPEGNESAPQAGVPQAPSPVNNMGGMGEAISKSSS